MKLYIILPTYNEKETLENKVNRILHACKDFDSHLKILIVDSCSPDGTGVLADNLSTQHPEVEVLHQHKKLGLAKAYLDGFKYALERQADKIIQMDVDGSHPASSLKDLWQASQHHKLVVGSRYCPGGTTQGWSKTRLLISKTVSFYDQKMLRLNTKDINSGFRCWDANLLREIIPLVSTETKGFAFQAEITYIAHKLGVDAYEVPIVFIERTAGKSKAHWNIAVEQLMLIAKLRNKQYT